MSSPRPRRLIRLPALLDKLSISRSLAYEWMRSGRLPKPLKLTPHLSAWDEDAIDKVIEALIAENAVTAGAM